MQFSLYEAGDMVQTPDGKALVIEDQRVGSGTVKVQLEGSLNTSVYAANDIMIMQSAWNLNRPQHSTALYKKHYNL